MTRRSAKRAVVTVGEGRGFVVEGRYIITAQKDGFAVSEVTDVILHVGDTRGLDVRLQLSTAPVEVRVSASTQTVETVSTSLGQVVTSDVVRNAPLNGRDIRDLALLQAGVTPVDQDFVGPGTFNINGNRADSVGYLLDGGLNHYALVLGCTHRSISPNTMSMEPMIATTSASM